MVTNDENDELIKVDGDDDEPRAPEVSLVFNKSKAHSRQIVDAWIIREAGGEIALVTVGHDALKVWQFSVTDEGEVESFHEVAEVKKWRCGVQSADVSVDGKTMVVVSIDSMLHEIILGASDQEHTVTCHDLGYMQTWFVRITKNQLSYITTSFSGHLTEVNMDGTVKRKEEFPNVKHISVLAYSKSGAWLAVANNEGGVKLIDTNTLKETNSFEVHSMKIRALVIMPDETHFVTGADDKTIKIHSMIGSKPSVVRILCGHRSSVTCIAIDERSRGQRIASGSNTGEILLWNIELSTATHRLPSIHESTVGALCFHPNGRYLISASDDRQIGIYKVLQSGEASPLRETAESNEEINMDDTMDQDYGGQESSQMSQE